MSAWSIYFFQRHAADDSARSVPARRFLDECSVAIRAKMIAVVKAVADSPPPSWSGGGYWEAMHGEMTGYYEVRLDEGRRFHHRLFCLLERDGAHPSLGLGAPSIILIDGRTKKFGTLLATREYRKVRALGDEYRGRKPRSVQC
jgi:hypothetical protein